ncbi:MAG: polysaccharide deacetylase family protein [Rhodothermales bacterium]
MLRSWLLASVLSLLLYPATGLCQTATPFEWPDEAKAAVSLTFDDARPSQVLKGTAVLDHFGAKATFYVVPDAVNDQLAGWKAAVAAGHEIGNHSMVHPCSGNFLWARDRALEKYSLSDMRAELEQANARLKELLGVTPVSFAYPCGQSFVGRGQQTQSYVPVIADLFVSGRGWLDEAASDPAYVDMAQLTGIEMDGKTFEEVLAILDQAKADGGWVVLSGHEMDNAGRQTTRLTMLEKLVPYLQDPANGFWLDTVGEIAGYVIENREQ